MREGRDVCAQNRTNLEETMSDPSLQRAVDGITWYHDFDFGHGLRAKSHLKNIEEIRPIWRFIEQQLDAIDFRGKSVLEIGTWDGYWSFEAERRGATRVLATDDLSQNWAAGDGIRLAKQLLRSNVEIRQDVSIYDLTGVGGPFDIILCLGVFYHLHDPLYAFTQLRHCCHGDSLVVLEGSVARSGLGHNTVQLFHSPWLEFLPSRSALHSLAQASYFSVSSYEWMTSQDQFPPEDGDLTVDRALLICQPFRDRNALYHYRPLHGLHAYDPRFSDGLAAALEVVESPSSVVTGREFTVVVRVHNRAWYPWVAVPAPAEYPAMFLAEPSDNPLDEAPGLQKYRDYLETNRYQGMVAIGVHLSNDTGGAVVQRDYARGFVASTVREGQHCEVAISMRAPGAPGAYGLVFDMVMEYVGWFKQFGSPATMQPIVVVADDTRRTL